MAKAKKTQAESWWYVLDSDRELPVSEQSRFHLNPMSFADRMEAMDEIRVGSGDRAQLRSFSVALKLVCRYVDRVENFPAGDPKEWPARGADAEKQEFCALLGERAVAEIGHHIWDRSSLESAAGNS